MANVEVEVLSTIAGAYGRAVKGDKIVVSEKDAAHLEKVGLVKVGKTTDKDTSVAEKGSVRIADETNEAKETKVTAPAETKTVTEKVTKAPTKAASKSAKK